MSVKFSLQRMFSPGFRIASHLFFWFAYMLYFTLVHGNIHDDYWRGFVEVSTTLPVKVTATYFTLYYLMPRFFYSRKYFGLTVLFTLSVIAFGYADRLLMHQYYVPTYLPDYNYVKSPLSDFAKAIQRSSIVYLIVFAAVAIKLLKKNYQNERLAQELGREKLDAELKFLKGQIHPHFLFNTLNTLYSLTLQNSPRSSEVVLKLSNFLDYMLYECNVDLVSLRKELTQVQNLIELEQLRYGKRLDISLNVNGETGQYQIPPLLLLPFVENSFKHGVSQNIEDAFVSIDVIVKEDQLTLRVENSKAEDSKVGEHTKGIGLRNVQRRLDLLYADRYDLQIFDDEEEMFMIVLRLPLTPNSALIKDKTVPVESAVRPLTSSDQQAMQA
jgi:two-component system, LytTR family, sensor kinase